MPRHLRVLLATLALVAVPVAGVAQQPDELDRARERLEQLEGQADVVEDRLAAAEAALDALQPRIAETSASLAEANEAAADANRAAADARNAYDRTMERLAEARRELATNQDELADLARDAYMYGPGAATPALAALEQLADAENPNDIADVVHMVDVVLGDRTLLVEESIRLIEETAVLTDQAERTRRARDAEAEAARTTQDAASTQHAEMMALLDEADRAVAVQAEALAELEAQQDATADEVDELEAAREAALAEARAAVSQSAAADGLVTVGGITVAESLGPRLEALLEAARADGIVLGGSGYRSPETTARLREANGCPDIHDSPSSACRIPTARPGTSMHEQGLAVDFTWNGQTICYPNPPSSCSGNAAFDWLEANAGSYGLVGLSTEAWHWSTNGN